MTDEVSSVGAVGGTVRGPECNIRVCVFDLCGGLATFSRWAAWLCWVWFSGEI